MARIPANAPRVIVDRAAGQVTLSGTVEWRDFSDGLGLARSRSRYEIELALEGTPFARRFDAPERGAVDSTPGLARVELDDPKFDTGRDVGTRREMAVYAGAPEAPDIPRFGLGIDAFVGPYNVGPLDGDQGYQFFIGFDADFSAITEVVAVMRVRQPVVGTDAFTQEFYRGVDTIRGKLELAALPGGGGGGGGATAGNDRLAGDGGRDVIAGRGGNDRIDGRGGNDRLDGGGGNDRLAGGAGRDRLTDGDGRDVLTGGRGADVFVLARDRDRDRIADFDDGRDRIDLSAFGRRVDFDDLAIRNDGKGVTVRIRGEVLDVDPDRGRLSPGDLDPGDFVFA